MKKKSIYFYHLLGLLIQMSLHIIFIKAEEGGYCAYIAWVLWVNGQGETIEEAKESVLDAYELMVECSIEESKEIPNSFVETFAIA